MLLIPDNHMINASISYTLLQRDNSIEFLQAHLKCIITEYV